MGREARIDALTGVLNRKAFFQSCSRVLHRGGGEAVGYFIMVDLDRFKQINDQHGHPEGDRVLRETARELETALGRDGFVGRVGGDEFALLLCAPIPREELVEILQRFQARLRRVVQCGGRGVSCSIGAQPVAPGQTAEELYRTADSLLYQAKQHGRDGYVIGPAAGERVAAR